MLDRPSEKSGALGSESRNVKNNYLFELSGEHEELPAAEVMACLEAQESRFRVQGREPGVLLLSASDLDISEMKQRLALTHAIDFTLVSYRIDKISQINGPFEVGNGSFAVRARRIQRKHSHLDLKALERDVADSIKGGRVDLTNPETEVRVVLSDRCHISILAARVDRSSYEKRKVQNRPYFSPVSLHPRLARTLVNLTRVQKGQRLLDPFCGTGGILIEAALVGAKILGSDIDGDMVEGCRSNLSDLELSAQLSCVDIGKAAETCGEVDCIATDPPYGNASTTKREAIPDLYKRAFETFHDILRPGGYACVVLPKRDLIYLGEEHLMLRESYTVPVHRSLTRHFCVFQKG
jgi:tRNA (guanine10-N2)-dimethyltransferase